MPIDHPRFTAMLGIEFPEVIPSIRRGERGILHCEMGAFRRAAEEAIDRGQLWAAERYFRFLERLLAEADDDVRNAVEVSFLEDFALGEFTPARHRAVKERMPRSLRKMLEATSENWR
jgi:hypothetical protein